MSETEQVLVETTLVTKATQELEKELEQEKEKANGSTEKEMGLEELLRGRSPKNHR